MDDGQDATGAGTEQPRGAEWRGETGQLTQLEHAPARATGAPSDDCAHIRVLLPSSFPTTRQERFGGLSKQVLPSLGSESFPFQAPFQMWSRQILGFYLCRHPILPSTSLLDRNTLPCFQSLSLGNDRQARLAHHTAWFCVPSCHHASAAHDQRAIVLSGSYRGTASSTSDGPSPTCRSSLAHHSWGCTTCARHRIMGRLAPSIKFSGPGFGRTTRRARRQLRQASPSPTAHPYHLDYTLRRRASHVAKRQGTRPVWGRMNLRKQERAMWLVPG